MIARVLIFLACLALVACDIPQQCKDTKTGATLDQYIQLNITKTFGLDQKSLSIEIPNHAPNSYANLVGLLVSTCAYSGTTYTVQETYYDKSAFPNQDGRLLVEHLTQPTSDQLPLTVEVTAYYDFYIFPLPSTFLGYVSNLND